MKFKTAVQNTPDTTTENGAPTFSSSGDPLLDLFFAIGASRGKNLNKKFEAAFDAHPLLTMRLMLWARDIRGGAGERQLFRDFITHLYPKLSKHRYWANFVYMIPEVGRFDDLIDLVLLNDSYAAATLLPKIRDKNSLAAKWMPRQGHKAFKLARIMKLSPKQWRKLLVANTNVVETKMCAKKWQDINYSHVPSLASIRYSRAFKRRDGNRYNEYLEHLKDGTAKVNANAVYPYDVIKGLLNGSPLAEDQWKALPNYLGDDKILPIVDASGSMTWFKVAGLSPLTIAISLGLYIADKQTGPFQGLCMTFSNEAELFEVKGNSLLDRYSKIAESNWSSSTNLENAFVNLLSFAIKNNIPSSEMPKYLLILSDMEFDIATKGDTAYETAKKLFKDANYEIPKIIFWNLQSRNDNVPVIENEDGVALVSGFSPSLMLSIVGAKKFDPTSVMLETISNSRYDFAK